MSNYGSLLSNTTLAIKNRGKLSGERSKQFEANRLQEVRDQQRAALFATINEALGIAALGSERYKESKDLDIFAQTEGYVPQGSLFSRIFGNVKYEKDGQVFSSQDILGLKALRDYERQRLMFDRQSYDLDPIENRNYVMYGGE